MGLRARLAVFFVAITVVPLTLVLLALTAEVDRRVAERGLSELAVEQRAAVVVFGADRLRAADLVDDLVARGAGALLAGGNADRAEAWLADITDGAIGERADAVALVMTDGDVLAAEVSPGSFSGGHTIDAAALAAAVDGADPPGVLVSSRAIRSVDGEGAEDALGWVVAASYLDNEALERLRPTGGLAILDGDRVLASTGDDAVPVGDDPGGVERSDLQVVRSPLAAESAIAGGVDLLAWAAVEDGPQLGLLVAVILAAVAVAGALGWLLAGSVLAPVGDAVAASNAIAAGDLDRKVPARGPRELAALGVSLDAMRTQLAARLDEVEQSRDRLRQSVSRLGQTLSSSLDLERTLDVVVATACDAYDADGAALWLIDHQRRVLVPKAAKGVGSLPELPVGTGIAGHVTATGELSHGPDGDVVAHPEEPSAGSMIAVPLLGRGQAMGTFMLLRNEGAPPFSRDDEARIRSFAVQTAVAVENVLLHEEARRLSVTDPLTGLWNFRYVNEQAERELAAAERHERPLSLLILDLDHFKRVNDEHGHQVGDEALAEVARRLETEARIPDVVARYGGEEFVLLLPDTDEEGALVLAERLRTAISDHPVRASVDDNEIAEVWITASIGVATWPGDGATIAGLLRGADAALYAAKASGRDRVAPASAVGRAKARDQDASPSAHDGPEDPIANPADPVIVSDGVPDGMDRLNP